MVTVVAIPGGLQASREQLEVSAVTERAVSGVGGRQAPADPPHAAARSLPHPHHLGQLRLLQYQRADHSASQAGNSRLSCVSLYTLQCVCVCVRVLTHFIPHPSACSFVT
jgi:hypothetical protein